MLPGDEERDALALFVAPPTRSTARMRRQLLIKSPEKRSGKTRLQEVLELLVCRPWRVTAASEAAMYRKIAGDRPTLLLDEIDAIFGTFSERTEPIRALLNAGNRPGATVARCVGQRGDEVRDFNVYCAKALAGIDNGQRIPDTIRDRSITIAMRRKTVAERVRPFRFRSAKAETDTLRDQLEGWGERAVEALVGADPDLPAELDDRAAEAWEPLLAIAERAGSEWALRGRNAALYLSSGDDRDEASLGTLLLTATREAFAARDRLATAELLIAMNGDEELPFGAWRDGMGLDGRRLAQLLRPYGIRPRTVRLDDGKTAKGYLREQLVDAWARCTPSRDRAVTSVTLVTGWR